MLFSLIFGLRDLLLIMAGGMIGCYKVTDDAIQQTSTIVEVEKLRGRTLPGSPEDAKVLDRWLELASSPQELGSLYLMECVPEGFTERVRTKMLSILK